MSAKTRKRVKGRKKTKTNRRKRRVTKSSSYSPSINADLVTLKTIPREILTNCNIVKAFKDGRPLEIGIPNKSGIEKCYLYNTSEAKKFLLNNLAANKHIDLNRLITPAQSRSNCWFNSMFVTFFISDKGRKFFHFLRQLMIEGRQNDGTPIPRKLRDVFALLNYGIDACLTGNDFAYDFDTNDIIEKIFQSIPNKYRTVVDVDKAGNPLTYYIGIINYLHNNDLLLLYMNDSTINWKTKIESLVTNHLPHIIALEIYDEDATNFDKKPTSFTLQGAKYEIDSAVIRDTTGQHFCTTVTCEGKQMGYDGLSFHRMVPMQWKGKLNTNSNWEFEGTNNTDGTPLQWNFTKSYQLLLYYRVA